MNELTTRLREIGEIAANDLSAAIDVADEAADEIIRLRAEVERLTKERDRQEIRGDNHWETLRSIRKFAEQGDCERIIQWVNDAGSGYTQPDSITMGELIDRAQSAEAALAEMRGAGRKLANASSRLSVAAQTTGGVAGRDEGLCAEIGRLAQSLGAFRALLETPNKGGENGKHS